MYAGSNPVNNIDPSGNSSFSLSDLSVASGIAGILATTSTYNIQTFGSVATSSTVLDKFSNTTLGWLTIAGMLSHNLKYYDLVKDKLSERDDDGCTVDLSRAVEDVELASMYACNCFSLGPNAFPKQFFHSAGEATSFGNQFIKGVMGNSRFHIVGASISQNFYNTLNHDGYESGIGPIVTVPNGMLPAFNLEVDRNGGWKFSGTY